MILNQKNLNNFINFAEKLIKKSEKIIIKQHINTVKVKYKKDSSPVTKIDQLIEKNFRKEIKLKFPSHGVYGEEYKTYVTNKQSVTGAVDEKAIAKQRNNIYSQVYNYIKKSINSEEMTQIVF